MSDDDLKWLEPTAPRAVGRNMWESRFVRIARIVVPVMALAILAVTLIWAEMSPETEIKQTEQDLSQVQNTLETARFTSTDEKGRPYVIEADHVVQQDPSTMTATLAGPRGEITMEDNDVLSVKAQDGVYDHPNQKLHLKGNVEVQQNADMTLETQSLDVDLTARKATSDQPVKGRTNTGSQLEASGLDMTSGAETVTFIGPAKLIIAPDQETKNP